MPNHEPLLWSSHSFLNSLLNICWQTEKLVLSSLANPDVYAEHWLANSFHLFKKQKWRPRLCCRKEMEDIYGLLFSGWDFSRTPQSLVKPTSTWNTSTSGRESDFTPVIHVMLTCGATPVLWSHNWRMIGLNKFTFLSLLWLIGICLTNRIRTLSTS